MIKNRFLEFIIPAVIHALVAYNTSFHLGAKIVLFLGWCVLFFFLLAVNDYKPENLTKRLGLISLIIIVALSFLMAFSNGFDDFYSSFFLFSFLSTFFLAMASFQLKRKEDKTSIDSGS